MARNLPNDPAGPGRRAGAAPSSHARQERARGADDLSADAQRALERLRQLDIGLAQRYEATRLERRKRRR